MLVVAPPIRILLVTARPEDDACGDIDHHISALPLVEAMEGLGGLVELQVSRDGARQSGGPNPRRRPGRPQSNARKRWQVKRPRQTRKSPGCARYWRRNAREMSGNILAGLIRRSQQRPPVLRMLACLLVPRP